MSSFTQSTHAAGVGQNHDRIGHHGNPSDDPVEITAVQKMLSATSGSLLTGLLGMSQALPLIMYPESHLTGRLAATPLDVVRVRWQSQSLITQHQPAPTVADFSKLALSTPNAFRPSDLGVTACCREVFFMNNTSDVCVVGPRLPIGGTGGNTATTTLTNGTLGNIPTTCAVEQTQQRTFNSTLDGLRKIARNEGPLTLWRGLSPTLVMAIPANIIYFTGYDWLRYSRASPIARRVRDEYVPLVAGSVARVLAATAVSPIELFRTRLQAAQGPGHLAATFRGVKDMVRAHGYRSLWRGLTLTLWRDVPFSGMYWWGYETIRGRLTDARERARGRSLDLGGDAGSRARSQARWRSQGRENHADTFTDSFIAGAASGGFASLVTMPFDVGKTRTQVYRDSASASSSSAATAEKAGAAAAAEEKNMARLLWHIFRTEGIPGLFKGWIPRTLRVAPACAIMISSYEVGKRVFRGVNERALLREQQHQHRYQNQH